jgi:hypothetical protein
VITGYLLGALTMLVGVIVGHLTGKPWLDRKFAKIAQQKAKNSQPGGTP